MSASTGGQLQTLQHVANVANASDSGAVEVAQTHDDPSPRQILAVQFGEHENISGSFSWEFVSFLGEPSGISSGGIYVATGDGAVKSEAQMLCNLSINQQNDAVNGVGFATQNPVHIEFPRDGFKWEPHETLTSVFWNSSNSDNSDDQRAIYYYV